MRSPPAHDQQKKNVDDVTTRIDPNSFARIGADVFVRHMDAAGRISYPYLSEHLRWHIHRHRPSEPMSMDEWIEVVHPEDRKAFLDAVKDSAKRLASMDHEFRAVGPDGAISWFHTVSTPTREADGGVTWYGIAVDVTDRKSAAAKSVEVEQAYRALMVNMPCDVFHRVLTLDGKLSFPFMGPYATKTLELPTAKIADDGWGFLDRLHPEDRAPYRAALERSARTLTTMDIEYRIILESGGFRWCRSVSQPARRTDGSVFWEGVAIDITEQKRTAEKLRESESLLAGVAANIPGGTFRRVLYPDGRLVYPRSSQFFEREFGVGQDAVEGDAEAFLKKVHPDDLDGWWSALRRTAATLERFDVKYRVMQPDGPPRWVRAIASTRREADGSVVWDGVTVDIDKEMRLQEELRQREERFRDFAASTSDSFWEMGPDLRFTWATTSSSKPVSTEITRGLVGRTRWEVAGADPEADEKWARHRADLEAHRPFRDFRYVAKNADGSLRAHVRVSGVPLFDAAGAFMGYRGTMTDETAEIEARAEAGLQQKRLADAIEAVMAGFVLFDREDRLVICNSRFRTMYPRSAHLFTPGTTFEEILTKSVASGEAIPPDGMTADEWIALRLRQHNDPGEPVIQRLFDGRWVQINETRTADGSIAGIRLDVTELKRTQEQLLQARDAAEAASRAKSTMLANVSHELRTPLNAIIGFAEVMIEQVHGPIGTPRYLEYARDMRDSGMHLLSIITDLIDMAKIEAGWVEMHDAVIDIAAATDRAMKIVSGQAFQKGVKLETAWPETMPYLRGDDRAVRQMLINLLNNSVKFTDKDGSIRVSAGFRAGGDFGIVVADTGIGIAADNLDKVAEPFVQADSTLTRPYEGAGLGLSITRGLIERHGGRLVIESELGKGTHVTLVFPAERVIR